MIQKNKNTAPYKKSSMIEWQGIIDLTKDESTPFKATIEKFAQNNCQAHDLDLKNIGTSYYSLYSLRINNADRILYTVFTHQNRAYVVLLEVVYNHDYQKSKFMNPGFLDEFMFKNQLSLIQIIKEQNVTETDEVDKTELPIEYRFVKKQAREWVILSSEQQHLLNTYQQANNIMLVSGGPGSGKSIAALSLLMHELQVDHGTRGDNLVYLTQSALLAETMQGRWEQQRKHLNSEEFASNPFAKNVYFLTYPEFIKHLILESPESISLLDKEYYQAWFESYSQSISIKSSNLMKELKRQWGKQLSSFIYKEFRILSGYLTDEGTLQGTRKSFFSDENQRKWIETAFLAYQKGLNESHQLDLVFSPIYEKKIRGYVVVDEAQDFSGAQLCSIYRAVEDKKLSLFYDFHQALSDDLSQTKFLMDLGAQYGASLKQILLSGSFRLPSKLVKLANDILKMGRKLIGGISDRNDVLKLEQTVEQEEYHQQNPEEFLEWINDSEEIRKKPELIAKICNSVDVAIITLQEYKNEVINLFKSHSVFTVEEIKGLEFTHIIVYRLFDSVEASQANNHLRTLNLNKEPQFFPKAGKGNYQYNHLLHLWFTAMTRPKQRLSLIQNAHHNNETILSLIENNFQKTYTINTENLNISTQEEWRHKAQEALKNANHEYARWICETKLEQTLDTFSMRDISSEVHPPEIIQKPIVVPPDALSTNNSETDKLVLLRQDVLNRLRANKIKEVVNLVLKVANRANLFVSLCADPDFFQQLVNNYWFIKLLCHHDKDSMPLLNDLLSIKEGERLFLSICVKEEASQENLGQFANRLLEEPSFISAFLKRNARSQLSACHRLHQLYGKLYEIYPEEYPEDQINDEYDSQNSIQVDSCLLIKALYFVQYLIIKSQKKTIAHEEYMNTLLALPPQSGIPLLLDILAQKKLWGNQWLKELIANKEAIKKLSTHTKFITILCENIQGRSCLNHLCIDPSGAGATLFFHLCLVPGFIDSLIASDHFAKEMFQINESFNSAFYWLLLLKDGQNAFEHLCQHAGFQKYLLAHADLFLNCLFNLSPNQSSPLYWLSIFSKDRQILSFLFDELKPLDRTKSQLQKKFLEHSLLIPALISLRTDQSLYVGTSSMHYLFSFPKNKSLIKALSVHIVPFLTRLPSFLETLLCCRPFKETKEYGNSLFFGLLLTKEGANFLYNLLENEHFLVELSQHRHFVKVLLTQASALHSYAPNRCALHLLLATNDGRKVFTKLWTYPDFAQEIKKHPLLKEAFTTLVVLKKNILNPNTKPATDNYHSPEVNVLNKKTTQSIKKIDNQLKQPKFAINATLFALDKNAQKLLVEKEPFIEKTESGLHYQSVKDLLNLYFPKIAEELLAAIQETEEIAKPSTPSL
ncbi:MAG: hypothetical protein LEGION0403_FIIPPAGN_02382 [Legionella sp.]|uniref:hypothetical protein n=1 Tax=Legionella sp. TaxID=459 RepID=UPI003D0F9FEA